MTSAATATPSSGCAGRPGRRAAAGAERPCSRRRSLAAQQAWHTSAASALAKMTARLGAGDTALGRRIRRCRTCPTACSPCMPTTRSCSPTGTRCSAPIATYSAAAGRVPRASIARASDNAPVAKRQKELVQQLTGSLERCPPGQKKAGCENSDRERETIGKQLAELSKAARPAPAHDGGPPTHGGGREGAAGLSRRSPPGATALRDDIDRAEREEREARAADRRRLPRLRRAVRPEAAGGGGGAGAAAGPTRCWSSPWSARSKSFVWAVTRERAEWAEIDASARPLAEHVRLLRDGLDPLAQQDAEGAPGSRAGIGRLRPAARARALQAGAGPGGAACLAGKRHLIVVPTGPLTSLPLQVLVTRRRHRRPRSARRTRCAMRAWLIKCARPERAAVRAVAERAAQAGAGQPGDASVLRHGRSRAQGPRRPTEQRGGKRVGRRPGALLPQRPRRRARGARADPAARYGRRAARHRQGAGRAARRHQPARGGLRDQGQDSRRSTSIASSSSPPTGWWPATSRASPSRRWC